MSVSFNADLASFYIGDDYAVDHTITNLPAGQTVVSVSLGFKFNEGDAAPFFSKSITTTPTTAGQITNAGSPAGNGTNTAEGVFTLTGGVSGDTALQFKAGTTYWYYIHCVTSAGANYTSEHATVTTNVGGPLG